MICPFEHMLPGAWCNLHSLTFTVSHSLLSVLQHSGEKGVFSPKLDIEVKSPVLVKFHNVAALERKYVSGGI